MKPGSGLSLLMRKFTTHAHKTPPPHTHTFECVCMRASVRVCVCVSVYFCILCSCVSVSYVSMLLCLRHSCVTSDMKCGDVTTCSPTVVSLSCAFPCPPLVPCWCCEAQSNTRILVTDDSTSNGLIARLLASRSAWQMWNGLNALNHGAKVCFTCFTFSVPAT